jgi:hypothetical protein
VSIIILFEITLMEGCFQEVVIFLKHLDSRATNVVYKQREEIKWKPARPSSDCILSTG